MNARSLVLVSLLTFSGIAWAPFAWAQGGSDPVVKQVDWPDTPAGRWGKAYVEAYNTPGRDSLRRFVKEYFSEAYLRENPLEKVVSDHFQTRGMLNMGSRVFRGCQGASRRSERDSVSCTR